ncbi:hypothetical protein L2E82_37212 [Cichorium intybus]|uniref:Uncharacterized protein n=1 Tax=Cichorium intybus TaxID=13427 RepID=A0ACB9AF43_CICIN|nr:hypothetical protein L2E82_37212 [Cichorium intybus]
MASSTSPHPDNHHPSTVKLINRNNVIVTSCLPSPIITTTTYPSRQHPLGHQQRLRQHHHKSHHHPSPSYTQLQLSLTSLYSLIPSYPRNHHLRQPNNLHH